MVVDATRRLSGLGGVPKAPLVLTREELVSAEELLTGHAAPERELAAEDAFKDQEPLKLPPELVPKIQPRQLKSSIMKMFELAGRHGELHESDIECLIKQLSHSAQKAMRSTLEAIRYLKESGEFARIMRADAITPEILARLESGRVSSFERRQIQKIARIELYRMFDDPDRDEALRAQLKEELTSKMGLTERAIELLEAPLDIALRERNQRGANAARAVLAELGAARAASDLGKACITRLGRTGDSSALPTLAKIADTSEDLAVREAARVASTSIARASKMTIVLAAMEAKPYCGVGGLSNVMGELPKALAKMGHRVIVLIPRHESIDRDSLQRTGKISAVFGPEGTERFELFRDQKEGVEYYFIQNDRYFSTNRGAGQAAIYGDSNGLFQDAPERYDFFSAAIPVALRSILGRESPDIVQLNDAHVAPAALYLKEDPSFRKTKSILAIHNMGRWYQGRFDMAHEAKMRIHGLWLHQRGGPAEFDGGLNLLKLGLMYADGAIEVSRQYMRETMTEQYGEGLHGILRSLYARGKLWGNLNGIDTSIWNSATDPLLPKNFSFEDLSGKRECKADLQERYGLEVDPETPLIGVVARLSDQKGFDDIISSMRHAMETKKRVQFLVVGEGDQ
jgi:starch synthase